MANLPEESRFDEGVYQVELTDPVIGGPNGVSNRAQRNLANRTRWLKDRLESALGAKADRASPEFTGTPTAPAPADGDNSTRLATTGWVRRMVAALAAPLSHVGSRGAAHAEATTSEAGFLSAADKGRLNGLDAQLLAKADRASPAFTGTPTAPTPASSDNSNKLATTGWVKSAVGALAVPLSHVGSRGTAHAEATASEAGFMSAADKRKLDTVSAGAGAGAVTSVAGRTGAVTLSVTDVRDAARTSSPEFTGTLRVTGSGSNNSIYTDSWIRTAKNFNSDANITTLTPDDSFVPNYRWLKIGSVMSINGKRGDISKLEVSDVNGAAPSNNASFTGTTKFSGTVEFSATGDARGRTWPATDNSVSFATTAWVRNAMRDIADKAGLDWSFHGTHGDYGGYIKLPSWLGGFIIQARTAKTGGYHSYPIAFPASVLTVFGSTVVGSAYRFGVSPHSLTQFRVEFLDSGSHAVGAHVVAIGR